MKRTLMFAVMLLATASSFAQSSGSTPPPPPYCTSANAGALYTNTGTSPATVYTCSYYNLVWQWVVNPSYGGLVLYPTVPSTCSGALPVFLAGWPTNTQMYVCVNGVPVPEAIGPPGPVGPSGPPLNWRGNWAAYTPYARNDGFVEAGIGYVVFTSYTSGATFGSLDTANSVQIATGCAGGVCQIPQGGTGATTAAGALANLSYPPVEASQQTGTAWGEKILNCLSAAQASFVNICDARGLTGAQSLDQNLVFTPSNASGMQILLPANLTVTQGSYQVQIQNGVKNFSVIGPVLPSNIAGTATGSTFTYCGSGFAWDVLDGTSTSLFTQQIELSHFAITPTSSPCDSSGDLYLGGVVSRVVLDNMRLSEHTSGTSTMPTLELNVPNTAGLYSQQLHIINPDFSGGTGVLVNGTGSNNWGQVNVDAGNIYASGNYGTTITGVSGGSGFSGSGQIFLSNFNNGCSGGSATVTLASGVFASSTPMIGAAAGCTNPTTATCNSGSTGTCTGSPVTINVAATTPTPAYQADVTIVAGEFTMHGTDLENGYYGVHTYTTNPMSWIRPDGCCTTYGVVFDGAGASGNRYFSTQLPSLQANGASSNTVLTEGVGDNDGLSIIGDYGAGQVTKEYVQDAPMSLILGAGQTTPQSVNLKWVDTSTGTTVAKWNAYDDANFTWHLEDVTNGTDRIAVQQGGSLQFNCGLVGGPNDACEWDYDTGVMTANYEMAWYAGGTTRVFSLTPGGVIAAAAGAILGTNGGTGGSLALNGSTSGSATLSVSATGVPNWAASNASTTVNGQTCALGGSCTVTAVATSVAFNNVSAATNTNALVIGTGGSLGVSGTGTIAATSVPAAGVVSGPLSVTTITGTSSVTLGANGGTGGSVVLNGSTSGNSTLSVSATGVLALPSGTTMTAPVLGTPASGVITNLTGTCTSCVANSAGSATTAGTLTTALAANQVLGSLTAVAPTGQTVPSCSTAASALQWTGGTGFACNTSITANSATTATTATNATNVATTGASSSASTFYLAFVASNSSSNQAATTTSALNFVPSTGMLSATGLSTTNLGSAWALNTSTSTNTLFGYSANYANITGAHNSIFGQQAGYGLTTDAGNTMVGFQAGYTQNGGGSNTHIGYNAGYYTTTGTTQVCVGFSSCYGSGTYATAGSVVAIGAYSGAGSGTKNVAVGTNSLDAATTGYQNSTLGHQAGHAFTTAYNSIAIGYRSGYTTYASGNGVTLIGASTDTNAAGDTNETAIGSGAVGNGSNTVTLGNSSVVGTYLQGTQHITATAPTASAGTVATYSTNAGGEITSLSAATTVTITFANSGWTNAAFCTATPSTTLATVVYNSSQSKTAVTFTFPALTGNLFYHCDGN